MTESTDNPAEQREPLAALHTYEPVPTHKLFPMWERMLRFGWVGALIVTAAVGYRFWKPDAPKPAVPVEHFAPASQWTSGAGFNLAPAISRDGKLVAYTSDRDGNGTLAIWTRPLDSGKAVRLTSGEFDETDPDFSPDGALIAYRSERDGGGIYVQPAVGGGPARLLAKNGRKPRFSPDGKWIAFFTLSGPDDVSAAMGLGQIFIVASQGGEPHRVAPSFLYARYPVWSPDGRRLLFTGIRRDGTKDWWLAPIGGGEPVQTRALEWLNKSLKTAGYPDQWQGDHIFFSGSEGADAHVWELPISPSTLQVTGPPRRVSDGKDQDQQVAIGPGGRLLFASLHSSSDVWSLPLDANQAKPLGKLQPLTKDGLRAEVPSLALNGSKMVYLSNRSGVRDVWVSDPDGQADEAVTSLLPVGYKPVLSPDGRQVVYPILENGGCAVTLHNLATPPRATQLKGCFSIWDWSPDGASLLTFRSTVANTVELMKVSTGDRRPVLFNRSGNLFGARFSPDGLWIAFAAGPSGARAKVFLAPLRTSLSSGRDWIAVSPDISGDPAWSPDGNVLYFRSKRDGFSCIWAQRLDAAKVPAGEPIPILHLHSALGLNFLRSTEVGIAVTRDRLILNLGRMTGNLWTTELPRNDSAQMLASVLTKR